MPQKAPSAQPSAHPRITERDRVKLWAGRSTCQAQLVTKVGPIARHAEFNGRNFSELQEQKSEMDALMRTDDPIAIHLIRFPIAGLFERVSGAIDRRLVEMLANEHQSDRQSVGQSAWQRHRRVVREIERRGV